MRLGRLIRRYLANTDGNSVLIFALTFMTVLSFIGVGIDTSVFMIQKARTQDALDEAALSAAISPSQDTPTLQTLASTVFTTNLTGRGVNATVASFKFDPTTRAVNLTANGTYKPFFLQLIGFSTLSFTVTSNTVRAADGALELALVLDNTWSMSQSLDGTQTKIQVLKTAAQSLVSTVMTAGNQGFVKVAVVPYADYVNVGTGNRSQSWLSVPADSSTTSAYTCKTQTTKSSCSGGTIGTCNGVQDGVPYTYSCWIVPQTCVTVTVPAYQTCSGGTTTNYAWYGCVKNQMLSNTLVMPDPTSQYVGLSQTSQTCLNPILPLTNDSKSVNTAISNLVVNIGGYKPETYIPAGLIWGVNVLSPPTPFIEGAAYDPANKQPRKAIVLMTDGSNTLYTGSSGTIAVANTTQIATTYSDQQKVCAYAKAKKIEIYTIGFGVTDTTALNALKTCATDSAHYFDAKSSASLVAAFQTIGGNLTKVRIVG